MEYYSAMKGTMGHATAWMNLQGIMLREKRLHTVWFHLHPLLEMTTF